MLIFSQDKDNIVNFKKIVSIRMEDFSDNNSWKRITAETIGTSVVLRDYKPEERAKEILSQILELYEKCQLVVDDRNRVASYIQRPKVYKMPKE